MAIFDIFSKRQKILRGDVPDVYTYDNLPQPLKVQIVHILTDTLGNNDDYFSYREGVKSAYKFIATTLCREYGLFVLPGANDPGNRMYLNELVNYLLHEREVEKCIDVVELNFKVIDRYTRTLDYLYRNDASKRADNSISELNDRFKEHGVGFQFIEDEKLNGVRE